MNAWDRGFETALAAAEFSNATRAGLRMGASLYSGPRLLSEGANVYGRSHPASNNEAFSRSTHCEHIALLRRRHYDGDRNLTLYVARRRADGTLGCSKPCYNCVDLCRLAGVRRIRYIGDNEEQKEIVL